MSVPAAVAGTAAAATTAATAPKTAEEARHPESRGGGGSGGVASENVGDRNVEEELLWLVGNTLERGAKNGWEQGHGIDYLAPSNKWFGVSVFEIPD